MLGLWWVGALDLRLERRERTIPEAVQMLEERGEAGGVERVDPR
jgi:hypothetical protein